MSTELTAEQKAKLEADKKAESDKKYTDLLDNLTAMQSEMKKILEINKKYENFLAKLEIENDKDKENFGEELPTLPKSESQVVNRVAKYVKKRFLRKE